MSAFPLSRISKTKKKNTEKNAQGAKKGKADKVPSRRRSGFVWEDKSPLIPPLKSRRRCLGGVALKAYTGGSPPFESISSGASSFYRRFLRPRITFALIYWTGEPRKSVRRLLYICLVFIDAVRGTTFAYAARGAPPCGRKTSRASLTRLSERERQSTFV